MGTMGGLDASLPSDKKIEVFRSAVLHLPWNCGNPSGRLYNETKATAIATIIDSGGFHEYSQSEGEPLVSYAYAANDVVFAQVLYQYAALSYPRMAIFEARVS